jgi:hypothetical protein
LDALNNSHAIFYDRNSHHIANRAFELRAEYDAVQVYGENSNHSAFDIFNAA